MEKGFLPPWSNSMTLHWPQGIEVQVEEQSDGNEERGPYSYIITQNNNEIATAAYITHPLPLKHGTSQNRPYFCVGPIIGIYYPSANSEKKWIIWGTGDVSLSSWEEKFRSTRRNLRSKSKSDEFFSDPDYGVVNFEQKGKTWIIHLYDLDAAINKDNDYYGGMPQHLHVESRDFGTTWKVRERISIPEWLIELPKKS